MTTRFALLAAPLLALSISGSGAAAPARQRSLAPAPLPDTVRVAMVTELGTITLDLDAKNAPVTTRNFVRYADQHRFDGITFYRVMRLNWGQQPNGLIQGGTQFDPKRTLPGIAHEPTSVTGVLHKAGAISMARNAPGTAAGDFSILLSDLPSLDADPNGATDEAKAGFAAFGHVVEGMDVVRKIYDVPLSATLGQGVMKGQMIEKPVRVISVRRVPMPAAAPAAASSTP
jgi:peptidyl-prolyl cis-trans isomerase A (cyclophilin A)